MMYQFRPFELKRIDYKNYKLAGQGRGINFYPKPRSGHRIVVNDSDLFCFGGFNPDVQNSRDRRTTYLFQELWKFNILTQRWSKVFSANADSDRMPIELASNAIVMKDDMLVVFGGTGYPFGTQCSNKCYLFWPYSTPKQISLLKVVGDKPDAQYGQAIMLRDKYLYVVGGTTGFEYSCDIYRLDLVTKVWECVCICKESIQEDPKGRYRHEIAYDDNFIYVFGGGTSEDAYDLETIPAFDLKQSKWIHIKTNPDPKVREPGYPEPRKCHSCIQYNTDDGIEVVIAGGYYDDQRFFNDIWKLNLRTFQWKLFTTTELPYPLYFHDAATSGNGLMYVFGGIKINNSSVNNSSNNNNNNNNNDNTNSTTSSRTNDIHRMWVTIPRLSEICWDALLFYNPSIPKLERSYLLQSGIPPKYVERAVRGQNVVFDF